MPIKTKNRFDCGKFKSKDGQMLLIPESIISRLKKIIRVNKFLTAQSPNSKAFGLAISHEYLFFPKKINITQSLKDIKSKLTYQQKKEIEDLRSKHLVVEYVEYLNKSYDQLDDDYKFFNEKTYSLNDAKNLKTLDGQIIYLFKLSQHYNIKAYRKKSFSIYEPTSKSYQEFLESSYWQNVRACIFTRDDWHCQRCGSMSNLEVHHKTYENHMNEKNHLNDLILVCDKCHRKEHKKNPNLRRYIPDKFMKLIPGCEDWTPLILDLDN